MPFSQLWNVLDSTINEDYQEDSLQLIYTWNS